jgi:hypothetical protein
MNIIKKLIIIILLSAVCCSFFNFFVQQGLKKYNVHTNERLSELFNNKTAYDIIFIGSSRTHTGINPAIIDSICKLNSYNFGVEGGNLLEFYYTFKGYLQNHPSPHCLVLTLDLWSFNLQRKFFNHTLYFNYTGNPVVKEMLNENGYNIIPFKLMPFLLLTEQDDYTKGQAFKGYCGMKDLSKQEWSYKGFKTNSNNVITKNSDVGIKPHVEEIDTSALNYLNSIITICKQRNIKLVFTYAPEFNFEVQRSRLNTQLILKTINTIAVNNHISYLRGDSLEICKDPNLFANISHLNKPGANLYSAILAKELNIILKHD